MQLHWAVAAVRHFVLHVRGNSRPQKKGLAGIMGWLVDGNSNNQRHWFPYLDWLRAPKSPHAFLFFPYHHQLSPCVVFRCLVASRPFGASVSPFPLSLSFPVPRGRLILPASGCLLFKTPTTILAQYSAPAFVQFSLLSPIVHFCLQSLFPLFFSLG